ncbi:hypothetical protein CR513_16267, partial [Mucuna pruriens]
MMTKLCEQFKIKHRNSTPYCPKMNGVVEPANKNIKRIIQKMVISNIGAYVHMGNPLLIGIWYKGGSPRRSRNTLLKVLAEAKLDESE